MDSDSELRAWPAKTNDWDHAGQRIETIASGKIDKAEIKGEQYAASAKTLKPEALADFLRRGSASASGSIDIEPRKRERTSGFWH